MINLKKIVKILVCVSIFSINLFALEVKKDYEVLNKPFENANNSVYEVWSYSCVHCFVHHKNGTLKQIKNAINDEFGFDEFGNEKIKVEYILTDLMGKYANNVAQILAYAKYIDQRDGSGLEGAYDKVMNAYFNAVFNERKFFRDENQIKDFGLKILEISNNNLEAFLQSKKGQEILKETTMTKEIVENYGTPAFIVNGKYYVKMDNIKSVEDLSKNIIELLKMK